MKNKLILGLLLVLVTTLAATAQSPEDQKLDSAIKSLRDINIDSLDDKQKETKAREIDEAWKVLAEAGPKGIQRIKLEIQSVELKKENDNFFKLNASAVLWNIAKADEADEIARIWTTTPVTAQYNYVFYTAFEAAQTQDPKVLPMLKVLLKDDKGSIFVGAHAMRVGWPLSNEFVWGAYGSKGLPVLMDVLATSVDPTEQRSAMNRLSAGQYLLALPRIRTLALESKDDVRRTAIMSLGRFGHPNDFEFLLSGLKSTSPDDLFAFAFALYEFDDERAVPYLIPLLKTQNEAVKLEVSLALLHLLTPESLSAVKDETAKITNVELKKYIERSISLREEKLPKDYVTKSRAAKAELLIKVREDRLFENPSERRATNKQLVEAAAEWKAKGRIYGSTFEWLGIKQIIDAGTPHDIEMLIDVKSSFYRRLSDECLYETADIDTAIKYIGRSRYRNTVGITKSVQKAN